MTETTKTRLIGPSGRPASAFRTTVEIDTETQQRLRHLLYQPFMLGVGYSEFIDRAVDHAYEEATAEGLMEGRE